MERALEKILVRLEEIIFDVSEARVENGKIIIMIEGVPSREVSMLIKTESWKVDIRNEGGAMEITIEGEPKAIERDLDDIVMVITAAVLLTIPRFMASLLQPLESG